MTEFDKSLNEVRAKLDRMTESIRNIQAENAMLRSMLTDCVGELCEGCTDRACENCKWNGIANGELK